MDAGDTKKSPRRLRKERSLAIPALRTWSLCVARGRAAFSFLCLSSSGSLHLPLAALTSAVTPAKVFYTLAEDHPEK